MRPYGLPVSITPAEHGGHAGARPVLDERQAHVLAKAKALLSELEQDDAARAADPFDQQRPVRLAREKREREITEYREGRYRNPDVDPSPPRRGPD